MNPKMKKSYADCQRPDRLALPSIQRADRRNSQRDLGASSDRQDFYELLHTDGRTPEQDAHFETLKQDFADRLMAGPARDAYDVAPVHG